MDCARAVSLKMSTSQRNGPHTPQLKFISLFGDANRVSWSNFNATILKFSEKFDHPLSYVFTFGSMFPESRFRCCAGHQVEQFRLPLLIKLKG